METVALLLVAALARPTVAQSTLQDVDAQPGEFPWTVMILHQYDIKDVWRVMCCGVLVHPQVTLTTPYCIIHEILEKRLLAVKLRAGEWDTKEENEEIPHQERRILHAVDHPAYKPWDISHSIAVVLLDRLFRITSTVQTIPIAGEHGFISKMCQSGGWGTYTRYSDTSKKMTAGRYKMRKISIEVHPNGYCKQLLLDARSNQTMAVGSMCAGGTPESNCAGESGAGLVCPLKGRYVLKGLAHRGPPCVIERPSIYVDVPRYDNWIKGTMAAMKRDFKIKGTFEIVSMRVTPGR